MLSELSRRALRQKMEQGVFPIRMVSHSTLSAPARRDGMKRSSQHDQTMGRPTLLGSSCQLEMGRAGKQSSARERG